MELKLGPLAERSGEFLVFLSLLEDSVSFSPSLIQSVDII